MRGVIFGGDRLVEVVDVPDPTPEPGEVVIEIKASGMCGTDLHFYRASAERRSATIRGHEPAGIVVAVGASVSPELLGTRVMVHHYYGCTVCDQCRTGWTQLCRAGAIVFGMDADGSHADFMRVPASTVLPLDDRLSFAAGATIGCGTGTAWGALDRVGLTGRESVVVFGQGPVGLSVTMFAAALGARVIAVDIEPHRLELADHFGAAELVNPASGPVSESVRELTKGRGVSISIETSGAPVAVVEALEVLDVGGTACYVGIGPSAAYDLRHYLRRQVTAMTSWTMSSVGQLRCAQFIADNGLDVDALFTATWALADAVEAYRAYDRQAGGKGCFVA